MINHVHLIDTPMKKHGVSEMVRSLGPRGVRYSNKSYKRTGTLCKSRFKSSLLDSVEDLLACMRYIEMNPVRALMVNYPVEYLWSSYRFNAQGEDDALIEYHPTYINLSSSLECCQKSYRELFRFQLDNEKLRELRNALNHEVVLVDHMIKKRLMK